MDWLAEFGLESLTEKALVNGSSPSCTRGGELGPNWIHSEGPEGYEQTFTQQRGPHWQAPLYSALGGSRKGRHTLRELLFPLATKGIEGSTSQLPSSAREAPGRAGRLRCPLIFSGGDLRKGRALV